MTADSESGRRVLDLEVEDEDDRYHRQNLITWWDQDRLREATVLVVGAGALGNELVKNLALVGVGHIVIADLDRIENSNLSRCVFFRESDEGKLKASVLAERAMELNGEVKAVAIPGDIRLSIGLGMFTAFDVVLGGLDNREARLHVNQACWKTETPFIDGAIEGLLGTMRVFVPPDSACYECTMSARDHELIAFRRTCALLSRSDMLAGKVPTTATTSSIIAAMQVQEAIKLLHRDRTEYDFAGKGVAFNGLTHDTYVVTYPRKDDCLSHDSYDLSQATTIDPLATFAQALAEARRRMGAKAVIDLETELLVTAVCADCESTEAICRPVPAVPEGAALCPSCGSERELTFTHTIDDSMVDLLTLAVGEVLPPLDVLTGRKELDRTFMTIGDCSREDVLQSLGL